MHISSKEHNGFSGEQRGPKKLVQVSLETDAVWYKLREARKRG